MDREPIVQRAKKVDLEGITLRKKEILSDIRIQKDVVIQSAQNIVAPFTGYSPEGTSNVMKKFNTGLAIFDGVMLGYKIMKNIRRFFRRR